MTPTSSTPSASSACHRRDRNPARIRVLIVDDHPAVRLGMQALIDDQPDMHVAAQARTVSEAMRLLDTPIDVAVVDYHLRDGRDGLALVAHVRQRRSPTRTLVYSAFADGALAAMAVIAGADGMLGKHELGDELCNAIRRVARGQRHLPAIAPSLRDAICARLEPVDQAIFGMLLHGVSPATTAEHLEMTTQQLTARRAEMLRSLRPSRAEPLRIAQHAAPLDYERPKRRLSLCRTDAEAAASVSMLGPPRTVGPVAQVAVAGHHGDHDRDGSAKGERAALRDRDRLVPLADEVAERAVAIGASPEGQGEAIAGATELEALPSGHLSDRQVLTAIGDRLSDAAIRARERIDRVAAADPVSCDLLIQVTATLETQLWMVRAQMSDSARASNSRFAAANGSGGS